jgi:hypothetical protein
MIEKNTFKRNFFGNKKQTFGEKTSPILANAG